MISINGSKVDDVRFVDLRISAVYSGNDLIWQPWSDENIWNNTYVSKQFYSVDGKIVGTSYNDRFEVFNGDVREEESLKFEWDDIVIGTIGNKPSIFVCFFDINGNFIVPREQYIPRSTGHGRYILDVPNGAVFIDVRIDDASSARKQCFVNFRLYKN